MLYHQLHGNMDNTLLQMQPIGFFDPCEWTENRQYNFILEAGTLALYAKMYALTELK